MVLDMLSVCMYVYIYGCYVWMDGWMDVCMYRCVYVCMDGSMDGSTDVCIDGWMDGWFDGWMDGSMDGWIDDGLSGRGVKLATHLQLVQRSRIRGSIQLLPHTPSWRRACLVKHRDNFSFFI
jgi:hypothetical protein